MALNETEWHKMKLFLVIIVTFFFYFETFFVKLLLIPVIRTT